MMISEFVIDTNAYSDWQRIGKWDWHFEMANQIWIPFVVDGELRYGFEAGSRASINLSLLDNFLSSDATKMLFADADTSRYYAQISVSLRRVGTRIPTNDIWIAALCLQKNLPLATSDSHFDHIPMLRRLEP